MLRKTNNEEDTAIATAIEKASNVIWAASLDRAESRIFKRLILIEAIPQLRIAAAGIGLAMVHPDEDGVVRRFETVIDSLPSLPQTAFTFIYPQRSSPNSSRLISYAGKSMTIPHLSDSQIKGKIVLVGKSLAVSPDPPPQPIPFAPPIQPETNQLWQE